MKREVDRVEKRSNFFHVIFQDPCTCTVALHIDYLIMSPVMQRALTYGNLLFSFSEPHFAIEHRVGVISTLIIPQHGMKSRRTRSICKRRQHN